ncbi:MAG: MFS transporter [Candidatus Kariarchaeaceae archaeon]
MIDENLVRKNIRAYLISNISWVSGCIVAIVGLWIRDDLTFSQMLLLQGLFALMLLLMEVPTGIIADLFERRKVLMFGHFNVSLGLIAYAILHGFYGFLFAEFFFSIGMASISGANTAAVWDTYLEKDDEAGAQKIIASGKVVFLGTAVLLTISGGILASYSLTAPLYIASVGVFANVVLYGRSYEVQRHKVENAKTAWVKSLNMFRVSKFKEAFLLGLITMTVLRIAFWAYIPKLEDYKVDPFWFGFVLAGANLVAVITTYLIGNREKNGTIITLVSILVSIIGVIIFTVDNSVLIFLIAIGFHQIGRAILGVLIPIKINQATSSDIRASAISLISMALGFTYFVTTLTFDYLSLSKDRIMVVNAILSIVVLGVWLLQKMVTSTKLNIERPPINPLQQ